MCKMTSLQCVWVSVPSRCHCSVTANRRLHHPLASPLLPPPHSQAHRTSPSPAVSSLPLNGGVLLPAFNSSLTLGILPLLLFSNGHVFFVQQLHRTLRRLATSARQAGMVQPSSPGVSPPDWLLTHQRVKQQLQQEGLDQAAFQVPLALDWAKTTSRDDVRPMVSLSASILETLTAAAADAAALNPGPYPKVGGAGAEAVGKYLSGLPERPFVVHNTFQFYKDAGKRARFREEHMWALDRDE